jgi:meso-butanediol dehydrogenase / (S,S)-butanediol dehydrogenase / diacetyl reductase
MKLLGRTAIVTGAAEGIGLAISKRLASEGAYVISADINVAKCVAEAETLVQANWKAAGIECDIRSLDQVRHLAAEAIRLTGRIDILVNNAAVAISGNAVTMAEEDWTRVLDTNLTGAFRMIQAVLPAMLAQGSGNIVNVASMQAHRSLNDWTAYAAAKGGLISMTVQLAGQFAAQGIRVNSISPGTINTPMCERIAAEKGDQVVRMWNTMHAIDRIGTTDEVAAAVLFLSSEEASFITGVDLKVDGGMSTLVRALQPE